MGKERNSSSMINDPLTALQKCVSAPLRRTAAAASVAQSLVHFILSFIVIFLILVLFPIFPFLALRLRCVCLCLLFLPVRTTCRLAKFMNYSYLDSERFTESAAAGTAEMADERTQPENSFINSCLILDQATSTDSNWSGQQAQDERRRSKDGHRYLLQIWERERVCRRETHSLTCHSLAAASFPHSLRLPSLICPGLLAQTTDNATAISHTHIDTDTESQVKN